VQTEVSAYLKNPSYECFAEPNNNGVLSHTIDGWFDLPCCNMRLL